MLIYLIFFAYRMMAASLFPRLSDKIFYWLFFLMTIVVASLVLPLALRGGAPFDDFVHGVLALLVLSLPCIILGTVGIFRKWRWRTVLLSCVLETFLFPVWFFLVFMVLLFFDGGD